MYKFYTLLDISHLWKCYSLQGILPIVPILYKASNSSQCTSKLTLSKLWNMKGEEKVQ